MGRWVVGGKQRRQCAAAAKGPTGVPLDCMRARGASAGGGGATVHLSRADRLPAGRGVAKALARLGRRAGEAGLVASGTPLKRPWERVLCKEVRGGGPSRGGCIPDCRWGGGARGRSSRDPSGCVLQEDPRAVVGFVMLLGRRAPTPPQLKYSMSTVDNYTENR